jgi:uncharacterized alkaline shock family protein YloU
MKDRRRRRTHTRVSGGISAEGAELGVIKIHENVIAAAVRRATCSIDGVIRLAGSPLVDNIAELIGNRRISDRAIAVQMDGDKVAIELKVNLEYGVHVPTVAASIQRAVAAEVTQLTGMTVTAVNVIIQELDQVDEEEDA